MAAGERPEVPKLRFPEFEGVWDTEFVGSLLDRQSDPVAVEPDEMYRQIGVRSHGRGIFYKEPVSGRELGGKRVFHVVPNAFVVNIVFAWEQAVALTTDAESGFIASHRFPMFLEKEKKSFLPFIRELFLRKRGKQLLELASPGGAGRNKTLGQQDFLKLKVRVPKRDEQKKIASFLGVVDKKLLALHKKRDLLAAYKRGAMQQIFSQKVRFSRDDGSAFPDWEEKPLGKIFDYEQPTKYIVESTNYSDAHPTPVLTAGQSFILGHTDETHGIFADRLPVIIFDDFTTASKYVDFPFKVKSSAMKILTLKDEALPIRLFFDLLQRLKFEVGDHKRHWISEFQVREVPFPHPEEQQKIANFLSALDAKIDTATAQITQMEAFKKGLLQQMFV